MYFWCEQAADHLITESSEEPNSTDSQTKHTRSTSKEKHMGVQDFRFFVTPVPETGEDSNMSTSNLQSTSSFGPPRPISFRTLVQLQSKRTSVGSYLDQPGPPAWQLIGLNLIWQSKQDPIKRVSPAGWEPSAKKSSCRSLWCRFLLACRITRRWAICCKWSVNGSRNAIPLQKWRSGTIISTQSTWIAGSKYERLVNYTGCYISEILTDRDAIRRKLVIAGDPFCGKLSLCS